MTTDSLTLIYFLQELLRGCYMLGSALAHIRTGHQPNTRQKHRHWSEFFLSVPEAETNEA